MANYPIAAVQAAVLKSAAGHAGQAPPTSVNIAGNLQNVNSDLAVMADQAAGYTAGVQKGAAQAVQSSAALKGRLANEQAQAKTAYGAQLQTEKMQEEQIKAQNQAALATIEQNRVEAAARAQAEIDARRRAAAAARQANYDSIQRQKQLAAAGEVVRRMRRDMPPGFSAVAAEILGQTVDFNDARAAIDNIAKFSPDALTQAMGFGKGELSGTLLGQWGGEATVVRAARDAFLKYAKDYHDAAQGA